MKIWPAELPLMQFGSNFKPLDPQIRTELSSGRQAVRRKFTATPVLFSSTWVVKSDAHARLFESFYQNDLVDGTEWFMLPVLLPQGRGYRKAQFVGIYEGPERLNAPGADVGAWRYSSEMQLFLRPEQDVAKSGCRIAIWDNIGW